LKWDERLTRRAAIWLAGTVGKPLLKLTDEDYNEHGLQELLSSRPRGGYEINIEVFKNRQDTITGWPGGKKGQWMKTASRRFIRSASCSSAASG